MNIEKTSMLTTPRNRNDNEDDDVDVKIFVVVFLDEPSLKDLRYLLVVCVRGAAAYEDRTKDPTGMQCHE